MTLKEFVNNFTLAVARKNKQANLATWILETTGNEDCATLKAELDTELRLLFNDPESYKKLLEWDKDKSINDPLLKRELNVLIRSFKPNQIAKPLLEKMAHEEADLALTYSNFRPLLEGKEVSENEIREILKNEENPEKRKKAWEASKKIGEILAPKVLSLVALRNESAKSLGYNNYFSMQLDLSEVDEKWLFDTLDKLAADSEHSYNMVIKEVEEKQLKRFGEVGPWCWSEPFCQEDPLEGQKLDHLVQGIDFLDDAKNFFHKMGLDVEAILKRSDNFEREKKNQHAFCINIDRINDIRVLNNIKQTIKWQETVLHELGHAVYEMGYDANLPWLLREPPHMITTEAMALVCGRQAYRKKAESSLKRRQLIFSRWVLVMSYFERELYRNPRQDLNKLWWSLVEKYQKIKIPQNREGKFDWVTKYHIGLAPVYYYSYLLGELFASSIEEAFPEFTSKMMGNFLNEKLFKPGNSMSWNELIKHVCGKPLDSYAWLQQFC